VQGSHTAWDARIAKGSIQCVLCSQTGTKAEIILCSPVAGCVRLGRLFNLPVASFPHLLRGDNVPGGDLPPWDAVRLSELMPVLLTSAKGNWELKYY
jgi:hypothetical protein